MEAKEEVMNDIKIDEIQIIPVKPRNGLLAFCSFVLNKQFYISDVAIYSRLDGGYRLVYPRKVLPNGAKVNCFNPINRQAASIVETSVIKAYKWLLNKMMSEDVTKKEEKANEQQEPYFGVRK